MFKLKKNPYCNSRHYPGHLCTVEKKQQKDILGESEWSSCRETFLNNWQYTRNLSKYSSKKIIMYVGKDIQKHENVKNFINIIEDKLKLSQDNKITFLESDKPYYLLVNLGDWWTRPNYECRMSLLTIFLRAGLKYKGEEINSIKDICKLHRYLKSTEKAVEKFLDGFTRFSMAGYGIPHWVQAFHYKEDNFNLDLLKIPLPFKVKN